MKLFYSYAHEDEELRGRLEAHLAALVHEGVLEAWNDRAIPAGGDWAGEINQHLESAEIVLLLISADFLNSKYCMGVEMQRALQRSTTGEAVVIPVILRPCAWQIPELRGLQALPKDGRSVTSWGRRDEAFLDIVQGIRRVVEAKRHKLQSFTELASVATERERVLDAAIAKTVPLGKPADLAVMVRCPDSRGLKGVLEIDGEYSAEPEGVRSKPFRMEFEIDEAGGLKTTPLRIRLESPDFDPPSQWKSLPVPPNGDSQVVTFFLTPLMVGELVLNLEVYAEEGQQTSKIFRVVSVPSDRQVKGRMLVSVPIATRGRKKRTAQVKAASPDEYTQMSQAPRVQPPPPPPPRMRSLTGPLSAVAALVLCTTVGVVYYSGGSSSLTPSDAVAEVRRTVGTEPPSVAKVLPRPGGRSPASENWQSAYSAGVEALKQGQSKIALEKFELASKEAPSKAEPSAGIAMVQLQLHEPAAAAVAAAKAAESAPDNAQNYVVKGFALQQSGRKSEAGEALRRATELDPSGAYAWYLRGSVEHDLGKSAEALQSVRKSVELDPSNADARLLLAALLVKENPSEAQQQVRVLDSLSPSVKHRVAAERVMRMK